MTAQPLTPLMEAARLRNAGLKVPPARFKITEPSSTPKPLRGEPSRMLLREAGERVKEARASRDAATKAHAAKRKEYYAKIGAVDVARGITTDDSDDFDTAAKQAAKSEAKQYLENAEALHEQWVVDRELGKAVGKEPPTLAQVQASITRAEAERDAAQKMMKLFEAEVAQREQSLSMAKRKRAEAQGELLRPVLEQLCQSYENKMTELIQLRQKILVVRDAVPGASLRLSGLDKAVSDGSTDVRNTLVKLSCDPDADLSPITKALRANGAAT